MTVSDTRQALMAIRSVMILLTELVHTTFSDFNQILRPQQCPFLDFNNSKGVEDPFLFLPDIVSMSCGFSIH